MGSYAPIYHMLHEQTVTVSWCPVKCKGNKETGYLPPPRRCVCVWRADVEGGGGCLLEFEINKTAYQNGQKACLFCISLACVHFSSINLIVRIHISTSSSLVDK